MEIPAIRFAADPVIEPKVGDIVVKKDARRMDGRILGFEQGEDEPVYAVVRWSSGKGRVLVTDLLWLSGKGYAFIP